MDILEIKYRRLFASGLIEPFSETEETLKRLLGVQAQYLNHGLFHIFQRTKAPAMADIEKTAMLGWGQRFTLHLYDEESWRALGGFLRKGSWAADFLAQNGFSIEKERKRLADFLKEGQISLEKLQTLYGADWNTLFHWCALFVDMSRRGEVILRLKNGKKYAEAAPVLPPRNEDMIARYIRGYGPCSRADAAHFFGVSVQEIKDYPFENFPHTVHAGTRYSYADDADMTKDIPKLLLLGKFDPLMLGYRNKGLLIDKSHAGRIWGKAGQISALILKDGNFAGTWSFRMMGKKMRFFVSFLPKQGSPSLQNALEEKCAAFAAFCGKTGYELKIEA